MFSMMRGKRGVPTLVAPASKALEVVCHALLLDGAGNGHPRSGWRLPSSPETQTSSRPESITELGLITSLSAYFGAVHGVASNTPNPSRYLNPAPCQTATAPRTHPTNISVQIRGRQYAGIHPRALALAETRNRRLRSLIINFCFHCPLPWVA